MQLTNKPNSILMAPCCGVKALVLLDKYLRFNLTYSLYSHKVCMGLASFVTDLCDKWELGLSILNNKFDFSIKL